MSAYRIAGLSALILTATFAAEAAGAVTPFDGSISVHVEAAATSPQTDDQFEFTSWPTFNNPTPLRALSRNVSAHAVSTDAKGKPQIDVSGQSSMDARWENARKGDVGVDISRKVVIDVNRAPQQNLIADASWDYTFTADSSGRFNLNYRLDGTGDLTGLGSWFFEIKSIGNQIDDFDLTEGFGDGDSLMGDLTVTLHKGWTYTVMLANLDQTKFFGNALKGVNVDGGYHAAFNWSIVPEPGTWALAVVGLGLTGARLRRQRALGAI